MTHEPHPGGAHAPGESGTEQTAELEALRQRDAQSERELAVRADRIRALSEELRTTRADLRRTKRDLVSAQRELVTLSGRRSVRLATTVSSFARRQLAAARRAGTRVRARLRDAGQQEPRKRLRATEEEARALQARLDATLTPSVTTGPLVSIVVVSRNGLAHLRRLLPALATQAYANIEVILVDNGSTDGSLDHVRSLALPYPVHVVANESNHTFSEANNQGAAIANGELLLLLNNDIQPAGPHVLGHLVARLRGDEGVAAVGARLIYPRRPGPRFGSLNRAEDLTLQHRGIGFATSEGVPLARNLGAGDDPLGEAASTPATVWGATAACLLLRRATFAAIGGFTLGYDYGQEDIDLCLKLHETGGRIEYEPQATFWHHESATQRAEDGQVRIGRQVANRRLLDDLWGPPLFRQVMLDRLAGAGAWAATPLHVGITITRDDPAAGHGDWHTGHELGDALEALGWRVRYLERHRDAWYEPDPTLDVVVALLDAFDIRRLADGVVTIAWVRNWTDRWLSREWFDDFDIVLASSQASKELIDRSSVHVAEVMPIATNPARFRPRDELRAAGAVAGAGGPAPGEPDADVLFAGHRWGEERSVEGLLQRLLADGRRVRIHGRNWDSVGLGGHGGPLAYDDLPAAYARASIVLDDAASPTRPYGSMNSRVFDALATGTLVVTDNAIGARELFGDLLPAADDTDGMAALVDRWLGDEAGRRDLAARLQAIVLERHTYAHRAAQVRDALRAWTLRPRVDIAIGPPSWDVAPRWGDYHFGRAFQRALRRCGWGARLRIMAEWEAAGSGRADAAVHIFGLQVRRVRPAQVSVLWIVSHPDRVEDDLLHDQDLILVGSDRFAEGLRGRTVNPVHAFHQATDPDRFRPVAGGPEHPLLFVGNSRQVRREIVDVLTRAGRDIAVYGSGWTPDLLDPAYLRGTHVPNSELAAYYAAAGIVLNDTWPDMAAEGFMSNRLYDASASGAFVISDRVAGIEDEFDGGVVTYGSPDELVALVDRYLADPDARREAAARARAAVLAGHTFAHRAATFVDLVAPLLPPDPLASPEPGRAGG